MTLRFLRSEREPNRAVSESDQAGAEKDRTHFAGHAEPRGQSGTRFLQLRRARQLNPSAHMVKMMAFGVRAVHVAHGQGN